MTPKERYLKRLQGKPVDRLPNFCIIMGFGAKYIGKSLKEYLLDYHVLAEANIRTAQDFSLDILQAISDPLREAEGFGAEMVFPENAQPYCKEHIIKSYDDVKNLKPFDPWTSRRTKDRLEAVRCMKKESGNEYPVMGWVEGGMAEASDLMGVNELMMALYEAPGMVEDLIGVCVDQAIVFAEAQIEAGADIIGVGDAVTSLIGPSLFMKFALEAQQRIFSAIKKRGAVGRLHICGDISNVLGIVQLSGADIIDVDWMVDLKAAVKALGNKACANGNFDPVRVVLQGTPETVADAVKKAAREGGERGFVMAGCEIPSDTPHINLHTIHHTLKESDGNL